MRIVGGGGRCATFSRVLILLSHGGGAVCYKILELMWTLCVIELQVQVHEGASLAHVRAC